MTHVCGYSRQSDEEGHKKELSIPSQRARFLEAMERRLADGEDVTWELAPADEGKSGGEIDREGLQWVLGNLDRFQELWILDHDRLVRHPFFGPYIMNELRSRNIRLWGPWGEDTATPMGRFMTDVRMRFGAYYREETAERTKMNRDDRLRQGLWSGHAPTGYIYVDENGPGSRRLLVPDPANAPRVRALFGMLAQGTSQRKACAAIGITQTTVIWQRDNPLYIGLVYKHREKVMELESRTYAVLWALAQDPAVDWLYPGRHEPLLEAETWDALEIRRRSSPKHHVAPAYGLSGRFRCAECGGVLRVARNVGKRHPSLRCERCKWEKSYLFGEQAVIAAIDHIGRSPEFERDVEAELQKAEPPKADNLEALRSERAKVTRQLDRALDLLMDSDEISQTVRERAVGLKTRRDTLDRLIAKETAARASRPTVVKEWRQTKAAIMGRPIAEDWAVATPDEQRALLVDLFSRIQATPKLITFEVRSLGMTFALPWHVHRCQVAGPGLEPGTP